MVRIMMKAFLGRTLTSGFFRDRQRNFPRTPSAYTTVARATRREGNQREVPTITIAPMSADLWTAHGCQIAPPICTDVCVILENTVPERAAAHDLLIPRRRETRGNISGQWPNFCSEILRAH